MWSRRIVATLASALLGLVVAGCGGGSSANNSQPNTLTYWASQQSSSLTQDQQILEPQLAKFQKQTGIKVNLEVISWSDLQNRILAAVTSGQGPDVVNIGNTWAASLQATGAFEPFDSKNLQAVGGKQRFLASSMAATGAPGQTPTSVPLYGEAYGLFYSKKAFAAAGLQPPTTWTQLVSDAQKLTNPAEGKWGLGFTGGSYTEDAQFVFQFLRQNGGELFKGDQATFNTPQMVAGIQQYLDLITKDKVVNPSDAEYLNDSQLYSDFASGKLAMFMLQNNAVSGLASDGVTPADYGVVPEPVLNPLPPGGQPVNSHVAGENISIFNNTKNLSGALKLVNFLTSPQEQTILAPAFSTLPVTPSLVSNPTVNPPIMQPFEQVLAHTAQPLPEVPQESQFETLIGNGMKQLIAEAASGKPVTSATIHAMLSSAEQQMKSSG